MRAHLRDDGEPASDLTVAGTVEQADPFDVNAAMDECHEQPLGQVFNLIGHICAAAKDPTRRLLVGADGRREDGARPILRLDGLQEIGRSLQALRLQERGDL